MPSQNVVKEFHDDAIYHVYNRGVERRNIFQDDQDYRYFLAYFDKYLGAIEFKDSFNRPYTKLSLDVQLLAYCLMPNHIHLVLKQKREGGITQLMRKVQTGYAMYFNQKYSRVGSLFQGVYKASLVQDDSYLMHLSRYVHLNPVSLGLLPELYPYSSYAAYLGESNPSFLHKKDIFELFESVASYQSFVDEWKPVAKTFQDGENIGNEINGYLFLQGSTLQELGVTR